MENKVLQCSTTISKDEAVKLGSTVLIEAVVEEIVESREGKLYTVAYKGKYGNGTVTIQSGQILGVIDRDNPAKSVGVSAPC